jgi:hypothetical protein
MKLIALVMILIAPLAIAFASDDFPVKPDLALTPGDICTTPVSFRYPENIAYCDRIVDPKLKVEIIKNYDETLHFKIRTLPRVDFKIDHYIPLCMGGSNSSANLWPQHKSVYEITDNLEKALCEKMADGEMTQAQAVLLIKDAKNNLDRAHDILIQVNSH